MFFVLAKYLASLEYFSSIRYSTLVLCWLVLQSSQPTTHGASRLSIVSGFCASPPWNALGYLSSLSPVYMWFASINCLVLLRQRMPWALALALARAGNNMLERMAMIAMTTSNSIKVNPRPGSAARDGEDLIRFGTYIYRCGLLN